eukprot:g11190.t1
MEMAAVLDSCHARAQAAEAQVAQLMQMMELNQQNQAQGVAPPGFGWPSQSHLSASEAQFQQRALQQTTAPIPRDKFPEDAEGSPISDASQANGKIQNQRGYLEELRSEDPRCIFIVRRINKLGFRSKSSLESHYQKYGKVLQVCVAHSKVKPLPNTGQTARTRPGDILLGGNGPNERLGPARKRKQLVLLQGSIHKIDGVEVSVQKYQPSGDNDEVEENDEEEPKVGHDVGGPSIENKAQVSQVGSSSGSTQTGGSSQGSHSGKSSGINSGDADDWNRQDSSGSNGSSQITSASIEGKDLSQDAWTSSAAPSTWASPLPPSEQLSDWNIASEGDKAQKFLIPFSVRELQELHSLLQFKSARDNEAELANILGKLQQLLQEQSAQSHFSTDHIMQAASLISVAKQLVHADCMAKMESLNASMGSQMPFERHLRTPGFDGLGLPDVSAQAMAMLQAQQQLQLWQSQVGAHAGAAPLPPPPFSDIASWMKSLGTPPSDALPSTGAADPLLPMTVPHDAPEEDVDENQDTVAGRAWMDAEHGLARPAIPSSFEALLEAEPQVLESKRVFQGEVLSRRVKSKHLTFCTLQVQSDEQDEHVALCFAAALVDESQVPSPTRRNDLPVGLQIEVEVVRAPRFRPEFLVRRWRRAPDGGSPVVETGAHGVSMARCLALKDQVNRRAKALLGGDGLALCKRWSGCAAGSCSEACEFRHYFQSAEEEPPGEGETKARHARCARERSQRLQAQEQEEYGEGPHEKVDKARRAARFAAWLVKTYGREVLSSGRGVLDVAGGQGDLSWQLSVEYGIPCTLIDPMVRRGGELKSWQRRALRKRGTEQAFEHLPVTFEAGLTSQTRVPPGSADESFPMRKNVNTATFKGMAVRDGDAVCLLACNGCFVGITSEDDVEESSLASGRRSVKADFPDISPPCALVVRSTSQQKQVLEGQTIVLQSLASAQVLCFDEGPATMEAKQNPGDLRRIGFQEEHYLVIESLPKPRRWKVDSISLEGELLKSPEVVTPSNAAGAVCAGVGDTKAIMFFEDDGWKMNVEDDTRQWCYQHLDAASPLPPLGRWATAVGKRCEPSPSLQPAPAQVTATELTASPPVPSSKVVTGEAPLARSQSGPLKRKKERGKQTPMVEFPLPPAPEPIRLGDVVYLRGNGRWLEVEGATVSAPNARMDLRTSIPATKKACTGCFLGISGTQAEGGSVSLSAHGRRWVKADFPSASAACAMVVKSSKPRGVAREVCEGEPFFLQSMASSQLLVADEKVNLAVMMQPKQAPGDLLAGPQKHQELSFKKVPRSPSQTALRLTGQLLKWPEVGVKVKHLEDGRVICLDPRSVQRTCQESLGRVGADGKYNLLVVQKPKMEVAWAGGIGVTVNGQFQQVGVYNEMPKYQQENGESIIYFQDGWKINVEDDTSRWLYEHHASSSPKAPCGQWLLADCATRAEPAPSIWEVPIQASVTTGAPPKVSQKALDVLLLSALDGHPSASRATRALRLALPCFAQLCAQVAPPAQRSGAHKNGRPSQRPRPTQRLARASVARDTLEVLAEYAETDESVIGVDSHKLIVFDGLPFLVHQKRYPELDALIVDTSRTPRTVAHETHESDTVGEARLGRVLSLGRESRAAAGRSGALSCEADRDHPGVLPLSH